MRCRQMSEANVDVLRLPESGHRVWRELTEGQRHPGLETFGQVDGRWNGIDLELLWLFRAEGREVTVGALGRLGAHRVVICKVG